MEVIDLHEILNIVKLEISLWLKALKRRHMEEK